MEQNSEQTSEKDLNDFNKKDKEDEIGNYKDLL